MKRTDITIEITFIEPIYGSLPGDKEIYKKFIASKAPDAPNRSERLKEEIDSIGLNETMENGMTGFAAPDRLPASWDTYAEGNVGYHLRPGIHFLSRHDWIRYIRYIKA